MRLLMGGRWPRRGVSFFANQQFSGQFIHSRETVVVAIGAHDNFAEGRRLFTPPLRSRDSAIVVDIELAEKACRPGGGLMGHHLRRREGTVAIKVKFSQRLRTISDLIVGNLSIVIRIESSQNRVEAHEVFSYPLYDFRTQAR